MKFPKHKCGLTLSHNEHKNYYESVEQYLDGNELVSFKDEESRRRSIQMDELWEIQWYPSTPIGFHVAAAPTLEEALAYALEIEKDSP